MTTLPSDTRTWTPDGPPPPPEAEAAVDAMKTLLVDLGAEPGLVARVATWSNQEGTTWVYVPALPLDLALRLAALGGTQ